MIELSVVIPVYRAAEILPELIRRLKSSLTSKFSSYELILVEDCSPDEDTANVLKELALKEESLKAIFLSRNFGQHYAISAGLEEARGEWVVVMDCDLQDQPEEIEHLYNEAQTGYDIVYARRVHRRDNFIKRFMSKTFYSVLGYLTDTKQNHEIANFGIYKKNVISSIVNMKDYTRYFPTMVKWVGFKSSSVKVKHDERFGGESTYNLRRLLALAIDTILVFSNKPLKIAVNLGLLISVSSFGFLLFYLYNYFTGSIKVVGWATLILSIWLLSGVIIFVLGIVGLYVGKIFDQVKGRPAFIVKEIVE